MPLDRGLWLWNTDRLLQDPPQIERLFELVKAIHITDVYLHVAPQWYDERAADTTALNIRFHTAGVRVWAASGDRASISKLPLEDSYILGLTKLGEFNERVEVNARFYGHLVCIDLQDTDTFSGFHDGVPDSKLDAEQNVERDVVLHQWINVLTRAGNLMHSYGVQSGAIVPYWLQDLSGEPVTASWAGNASSRTCVLDLIKPLVDQLVVLSYSSESVVGAERVGELADYTTTPVLPDHQPPRLHGCLEVASGSCFGASREGHAEVDGSTTALDALQEMEAALQRYPTVGGTVLACETVSN